LSRPVIGLPTVPIAAAERRPPRFGINQAYVRALSQAGAAPLLIPLLDDNEQLRSIYERLDGIVFPGGEDVDPQAYGEERIADLNIIEPSRDRVELRLAQWAYDDDIPVLGICRGQQLLNVAYGGTLYQDLLHQQATSFQHAQKDGRQRSDLMHRVVIDPDSMLAQLIDETEVKVNSLHHQAVKEPAPRLRVTAKAEDGVIEALESGDRRFLLAVQWHPEEIADLDWVKRLFRGFVKAAQT
jgi:putative glutamine amidotransferase